MMLNPLYYTQDILMSPITYVVGGLIYLLFWDRSKTNDGIRYVKYPNTSSINPVDQRDGKRWSTTSALKFQFPQRDNSFYIGNFRFVPKMSLCRMPRFWRKWHEKTKIHLSQKEMRQTSIVYGGMGSGKTVFMLNLLEQKHLYNNAIVHDGGTNELVSKLFKKRRDIIFNAYDNRAKIWDFLSEDTSIQKTFFQLLLKDTSQKKDFFTTGAADFLYKISLLTQFQEREKNLTKKEKWDFFVQQITDLQEMSKNFDRNSEKDIISTMKQILEPILLMNFRIQNGAKTFVIQEFLKKENGAKLFVSYPSKLQANMQSLSSAFIAIYTLVHLSQPNTEKNYLYLIDEMSSYLRLIDQDTLKDQLEKLRKKGGMFVGGLQGVEEKEELNGIIDKTINTKIFFRTDGNATKEFCKKSVGKRRYIIFKQSSGEKKNSKNFSREEVEKNVVEEDDFNLLGNKHEYIAKTGDYLFRGYVAYRKDEDQTIEEEFIEFEQRQEFEDYQAKQYRKEREAIKIEKEVDEIADFMGKQACKKKEDDEFGNDFEEDDEDNDITIKV